MAIENRMPTISRINKETRDNDFIPITELKDFDKKLKDVIDKFNTIHVDGSDNLANKLKNIEYNLADAIKSYDPETGIYEYDTITDDEGNKIPNYGPKALTTMVNQLHEYYNEFIKLMGNDPNRDNWKEPLNAFFINALNDFENKISSIFKNSINAAVIEAKDNDDLNYMSKTAVKLQENDIMRLNPDVTTYLRTINVNIIQQYRDIVAFEITEAETKSFVINLKIQNGEIYYDLDIILDNDNWFINKSKIVINETFDYTYTLKLNIYRYTKDNKNNYVFCINTDYNLNERINFEIQGIFVQKFNFNNSNLLIDNHNEYYKYIQVEDTSVTPIFNETYYTIEVDANDTDNYNKNTYVPHTRLTSFDQTKTYYTRKSIFTLIKTYDVINDVSDGEIKDDVIDVKNDDFVLDNIYQKNGLHKVSINYEIDEAIDNHVENQNVYIGANDKTQIDDSYRCYKIDRNNIALVTKSVKKVDKKISCAYGEALFDLTEIGFNQIVSTNSYVNENIRNYIKSKVRDIDNTDRGKSERFALSANTVYKLELNKLIDTDSNDLQPKYNLVTKQTNSNDINPNLNLDTINEFIFKNITFVTFVSFDIYEVGGELSVIAIPDNNTITDSNIYYHFVINVGKNFTNIDAIKVLVFNKMYKRDDEFVGKYLLDETFVSVAANDSIMVGITDKNEIYYSFYGDLWYPNKSFNETYANDHFYENFIQGREYKVEWTGKIFIYYPNFSNNQLDSDYFEPVIFWSYDGLNWNKFIFDKYFVDESDPCYYGTLKIYNEDRIAFFYLNTDVDEDYYDKNSYMNEYIAKRVMICDNYAFTHYNHETRNFDDIYNHVEFLAWSSPINLQYVDNKWISFYNGSKNNLNMNSVGCYLTIFKENFGGFANIVYQKNFKTDGILYGETDDEAIHENGWNVSPTVNYNRLFASNDGVMFLYDDSITPSVNAKMPLHILEVEDQDNTTKIFLRATVPNAADVGDPNGMTAVKFVDVSTRYRYSDMDDVYRRIFGLDNNNNIVSESNDDGISWHKPYIDGSGNIGSYKYILSSKHKFVSSRSDFFFVQNNNNSKLCTVPYYDTTNNNSVPSAGSTYDNGAMPKKIIEINHQSINHGWFIIISNTGKLSYRDNNSIRQCSVMPDDPVTSLIELNDRILGETTNHNISPNYGYDDMYDPYTDYDIGIDRDIDINLYKTVNGYEFYLDVKRDSNNNLLGYTDLMYRQGKLDHGIYCRFDFTTTYFKPDNYFISYNCKERGNTYNPIIFLASDEMPGIIFGELKKASEYDSNNEPINTIQTYYLELPIYVENAVENSDGFFIYGRDDYDIYHVYVSKVTNNDIHFEEILEVDGIDFFKVINDEIVISAYGSDPDNYYVYDKDTVSFITREYLENSERYDFSQLFEHKGNYYFINGTGTNYHHLFVPGLCRLDFSQNVIDHKKDISIIKQENGNFNTSNQNMTNYITIIGYKKINFIPNIIDDNNVDSDLICISGIDSSDNPIKWIYIVDWNNGDLIDLNSNNINVNSDYITTLKEILQKNSSIYTNELIVQKSAYNLNAVLNDSADFDKYCQKDEIYFDKETKTLEFNNYGISNDDKFIIESKKIAVSQMMNSNKLNIIMVLSRDSAIGYYNRDKKEINVLKCGYYLDNIYVQFDTNYNNMKSIIIGDNGHIEYAFIVVDGTLPYLSNGQVTYPIPNHNAPSIEEHHLFKIAIKPIYDDHLSIEDCIISGYDNISLEKVGSFATYQDIYDYIEEQNFSLSKSIYLYENENIDSYDSEFLGVYSDALYDNSYSFVEWNTVKKCLEFKTKLLFDTSLTNSLDRDHNIITDRLVHVDPQNFNTDYDKVIYVESNHSIPFNTDRNNSTDSGVDLAPINFTNKKIINPILDLQDRKNYDLLRSPDLTYSYKYTGQYQTPHICFNYLQHLQTQYGVFRFANKNYFDCLQKSTHVGDILTRNRNGYLLDWNNEKQGYLNLIIDYNVFTARNYSNNIYFTPHGSKDIIRIIPDHDARIVEIYETYSAGIFIQVEDHIVFDDTKTSVYKLYHLINLPVDTNNPTIIIGDTRYFDEMSTNYAEITDLKECTNGQIYALGVEPSGLSVLDEEVANIGNSNVGYYPRGKSYIFAYNGLDFVAVNTFYLDKDNYASWPYLTKIFEKRVNDSDVSGKYGTYTRFYCVKCFDITNGVKKYTSELIDVGNSDGTDVFFGNSLNNTDNNKHYVISPESIEASKNHIMLPRPIEDTYANVSPFLYTYFYGPGGTTRLNQMKWININAPYNSSNRTKDVLVLNTSPIFSDTYYTKQRNWILTYPMFSKTTSDNLYLLKLLNNINNNSPDLPLNTNLHAIGFIIYKNNSKVLIDGINIVTNAGDNKPVKIIFNIDKRFRNVSGLNRSDIENGQIIINNDSDMIKANFDIIY